MLKSGLFNWFNYPTVCDLCGIRGALPDSLCHDCLDDLPRIKQCCRTCGRALSLDSEYCGKCQMDHFPGQRVIAAFSYSYPLDVLIKQLKYKQRLSLVSPLAKILTTRILSVSPTLPEVMIPVPLHPHRLFTRGFNQSQQICRELSRSLPLLTDAGLVIRVRNTLPMYDLDAEQRKENIEGAFRLVRHCRYKSLAIVDDIITSCSTMNELARLFHNSGVEQIQFWALARAD